MLALAACGSGGSDDNNGGNGGGNTTPTASAGSDQSVFENTTVNLNGSGSDPDTGDTLTYSWTQTAGGTVTINNANMASASFMAPDVTLGAPETLTFQLTVSDGTANRSDSANVLVQEPQPTVMVSGVVSYEFVPPFPDCRDLDFSAIETRPIRGATVQLVDANTQNVLQTTTASATGDYVFANVNANSMVNLRVRAELKQIGTPGWDIEIRDNFLAGQSDSDFPPPPAQGTRAQYRLDGADFDTGAVDVVRNLTAATGWGGSSYTNTRAAAPFAILDALYSGIQLVLTADQNAIFPPMDAFWSVNNTENGSAFDITAGEFPVAFYSGGANSLYLHGDAALTQDEFDDHVIMHEWGHYFESNFSRSDSIGGPHTLGQSLDARLAFGEGWATAFGAMALNDPQYCDTHGIGSNTGFGINTEIDGFGVQGWFNEISVATLLYDLWDTTDDGTDNGSIGFRPIFDTMIGPQRVSPAWTTVHTFAAELRPMLNVAGQALLDSQMERERINDPIESSVDIWASTENNDVNGVDGSEEVLPLYTDYTADGTTANICVNNKFDTGSGGNKLAEYRYLRLTIPTTGTYNVVLNTVPATPTDPNPPAPLPPDYYDHFASDPDIFIQLNGQIVAWGLGGDANEERFPTQNQLIAGNTYVADLHEFYYQDTAGTAVNFPDVICFDYSMTLEP
jgi:hypothetical protein